MNLYNEMMIFLTYTYTQSIIWFKTYILDLRFLLQTFCFIGIVYALSKLRKTIKHFGKKHIDHRFLSPLNQTIHIPYDEIFFILMLPLTIHIISQIIFLVGAKINFFSVLTPLSIAWSIIRLFQNIFDNSKVGRMIAWMIWGVAALNISGYEKETIKILKSISLNVGSYKLTLFSVVESILVFTFVFWIATLLVEFVKKKVQLSKKINASEKVLAIKALRFLIFSISGLYALNLIGIDITTLTVLSGAIVFGLGFGLQKIVANFISGIILLLDRSIKPGDIIAFGDSFGQVKNLEARYVSIEALDGKKILIPNEFLVTNQVENWSFGNNRICLGIPVGVSYDEDIEKIKTMMLDIADKNSEVLSDPPPRVFLRAFGESTINLELRAWIEDPSKGYARIKSDLMYAIWHAFRENNIIIPYPQRDIHIKNTKKKIFEE
jgi:small-conductance mechanosensitive channel